MPDLFSTSEYPPCGRSLVVHYGGGTNSTALLIGLHSRNIRPDAILFADTGGEKPETYQFQNELNEWLGRAGFPGITTVRYPSHKDTTLEDECRRLRIMPSIVYGHRNCSQKWKLDPQLRWIRAQYGETGVIGAVGFDYDEFHRAKPSKNEKLEYLWYPLIGWKWGRDACKAVIRQAGLSQPGKSACFFCPSSRKPEIIQLAARHPDLYQRAVEMEKDALAKTNEDGTPVLRNISGLGRHWSWKQLVEANGQGGTCNFVSPPDIPCDCFDGDDDGDN